MTSIKVVIDQRMDAINYRGSVNRNTNSSIWRAQLENIDFDFSALSNANQDNAYEILAPYLDTLRTKQYIKIATEKQIEMQEAFNQLKDRILERMEQLTKHPLYLSDFTIFLTSLNRGPYNWQKGYTWSCINWTNYIFAFIHELLHFQTHYYYESDMMEVLQDRQKFEDIKESLTFLLNYEFQDIVKGYDKGYPQHQELRKKLEEYRVNSEKDFDKLIKYAITCV